MLNISGPMAVFAEANTACQEAGRPPAYEIVLAGPRVGLIPTSSGLEINAKVSFFDENLRADTVVICGGRGARMAADDTVSVEAIGRLADPSGRVFSICPGAFGLAGSRPRPR